MDEFCPVVFAVESYNKIEESRERDSNVESLITRIKTLTIGIEGITFEPLALENESVGRVYIDIIWSDLLPSIDRLSKIKFFRNEYEDFSRILDEIIDVSQKGMELLRSIDIRRTK